MRPFNRNERPSNMKPLPTLFKKRDHLKRALSIATTILSNHKLTEDEEGFCQISDLLEDIRTKQDLSYMNIFHICELYFKDKSRRILINGTDRVKYKEIRYVQPPDILYFGTLSKLSAKMMKSGLKSSTKGYLKLYDTPELAKEFGSRFVKNESDKIATLKINAGQAFSEGLKFSTYKEHEFIVVQINRKYVEGISTET